MKKSDNKDVGQKKILFWIFIILSIVPLFWPLVVTEPNSNAIAFYGLFTLLMLFPYYILLWSTYGIILLYKKLFSIYKKNYKLGIIMIIVLTVVILGAIMSYFNVKNSIADITRDYNEFIVSDGKVYYISNKYTILTRNEKKYLNVVNLDGSKNKNICQNNNLNKFSPKFINDDYIYYYDSLNQSFNKINISNCEKNNIIKECLFIYYDKDNKYVHCSSNGTYKKYDIINNKVLKKIETGYNRLFINYENFDIYYLKLINNKKSIYKNDKLIYSFEKDDIHILGMTNKSLLLYNNDQFYKFDLEKNDIVDKVKYNRDIYIEFGTISENYFRINDDIYIYDDNIRNLEMVLEDAPYEIQHVENFDNKLVLEDFNDNLIIYNKDKKNSNIYENSKYSYDYKNSKLYVTSDEKIIEVK